jgi:hypothetical protein
MGLGSSTAAALSGLYRLIARRMRGYDDAQARQIFRDLIDMPRRPRAGSLYAREAPRSPRPPSGPAPPLRPPPPGRAARRPKNPGGRRTRPAAPAESTPAAPRRRARGRIPSLPLEKIGFTPSPLRRPRAGSLYTRARSAEIAARRLPGPAPPDRAPPLRQPPPDRAAAKPRRLLGAVAAEPDRAPLAGGRRTRPAAPPGGLRRARACRLYARAKRGLEGRQKPPL